MFFADVESQLLDSEARFFAVCADDTSYGLVGEGGAVGVFEQVLYVGAVFLVLADKPDVGNAEFLDLR